jgi:hypothetical protein
MQTLRSRIRARRENDRLACSFDGAPNLQEQGFGNFVKQLKSFVRKIGRESYMGRILFLDDRVGRESGFGAVATFSSSL